MKHYLKPRVESLLEELDEKIQEYSEKNYCTLDKDWTENPLCSHIFIRKCCLAILDNANLINDEAVRFFLISVEPKVLASVGINSDEENNIPPNDLVKIINKTCDLIPKEEGLFGKSNSRQSLRSVAEEVNRTKGISDLINQVVANNRGSVPFFL